MFDEQKEMPTMKLEEFKALCTHMFEMRDTYEKLDREAKDAHKKLEEVKGKVLATLEEYGLEKFHVAGFGTIGTRTTTAVKMPTDPEKKQILMNYLRENNLENLLTVNYQTLNGYYKSVIEAQEASGEEVNFNFLPGVEEPQATTIITMRKG